MIAALDLVKHPENVTAKAVILQMRLRPNVDSLSPATKFEIAGGSAVSMDVVNELTRRGGGSEQIEGHKKNHENAVARGEVGVALLVFMVEGKGNVRLHVAMGDMVAMKIASKARPGWDSTNWVYQSPFFFPTSLLTASWNMLHRGSYRKSNPCLKTVTSPLNGVDKLASCTSSSRLCCSERFVPLHRIVRGDSI
jgi:hypothetical protein